MFNKNIIIGVIVVVLLGGGVTYYFLNGSSNTNINIPAPVTKNGELTRELARQIALEQLKAKPIRDGKLKDVTITGISMQSETAAMVNMVVEYEPTPANFGIQTVEVTMPFALYDYGWGSFGW